MRKFSTNFKNLTIIIILFIAFFIINAHSYAINVSNGLSSNIFRLHILANSDSEEDQALKLKVRDAILQYMDFEYSKAGQAICDRAIKDAY